MHHGDEQGLLMVQEQVGLESDIVDGYDKGNFEVRSEFLVVLFCHL